MHILVVGGAGYIGSHAVQNLISHGEQVTVLDALYTGHRKAVHQAAKFYQGDLRDTFLVSQILRKEKIDAVMHFAAYSLVPESVQRPLKYYDNNVTGMISLLKAMQETGTQYLIFSSLLPPRTASPQSCRSPRRRRLTPSTLMAKPRS